MRTFTECNVDCISYEKHSLAAGRTACCSSRFCLWALLLTRRCPRTRCAGIWRPATVSRRRTAITACWFECALRSRAHLSTFVTVRDSNESTRVSRSCSLEYFRFIWHSPSIIFASTKILELADRARLSTFSSLLHSLSTIFASTKVLK